jgi:hypothetical protein
VALVVGDPITARYEVRNPATGALTNATVTITVTKPDGTLLSPGPTPGNVGTGTYDTAWLTTVPGVWRWTYTATGTVSDTSEGAAYVFPAGTVVPWRPGRKQVAKYVPERTLQADQLSDVPLNDFTDLTTPTATQADDHIDAALSWVALRTGAVDASLYVDAAEVVAIRAAGMIELSAPVRNADISTAEALLAQADLMIERLVLANEAASPITSAPGLLSAWAFPDPEPLGDSLEIF